MPHLRLIQDTYGDTESLYINGTKVWDEGQYMTGADFCDILKERLDMDVNIINVDDVDGDDLDRLFEEFGGEWPEKLSGFYKGMIPEEDRQLGTSLFG